MVYHCMLRISIYEDVLHTYLSVLIMIPFVDKGIKHDILFWSHDPRDVLKTERSVPILFNESPVAMKRSI